MKKNKKTFLSSLNVAVAITTAFTIVLAYSPMWQTVHATSIDQQIKDTANKLGDQKAQTQTLASEIAAFDGQIQSLESQIQATQTEMANLAAQIDNLNKQIADTESNLKIQKETLNEYMRVIYEESNTSTLELVAGSNNFSDFVDKTEYLQTMQIKVKDMVDKIKKMREELEKNKKALVTQKDKVVALSKQQNLQKKAVDSQRAAKDNLLAQSKGQENLYKQTLTDLYAQRAELSRINNEGNSRGGGGGYPYSSCGGIDAWSFYTCQCTSYAAWRSAMNGPVPGSVLSDWGSGHRANGGDWGALGSSHGYTVNSTPSAGAIMSFPYQRGMPYGHVAIVDSVNSDGTVNVSEYNYSYQEAFGTRTGVNPSAYSAVFIH